jgi:type II restriction/modification system DNA methylase subunit YeeA
MKEGEAAMYEMPFSKVRSEVKPFRETVNREGHKKYWWRYGETRSGMRTALAPLKRYIATPRVTKHRMFVWLDVSVLPDSRLYAIALEDDATFGVLSSRIHEVWALANASKHGDGDEGGRPTYNAKSCFETFPFPDKLAYNGMPKFLDEKIKGDIEDVEAVAAAAKKFNELRNNWLNPPEWTDWVRTAEEE